MKSIIAHTIQEVVLMEARAIPVILAITFPLWFSLDVKAQGAGRGAAAPSPYPVVQGKVYRFEKITDGVYYATGGSNTPIIVNDRDVMIVDDGTTPFVARALIEDLKVITD